MEVGRGSEREREREIVTLGFVLAIPKIVGKNSQQKKRKSLRNLIYKLAIESRNLGCDL